MYEGEQLNKFEVFLCKFNRFTKALDAIFFESLSKKGE